MEEVYIHISIYSYNAVEIQTKNFAAEAVQKIYSVC